MKDRRPITVSDIGNSATVADIKFTKGKWPSGGFRIVAIERHHVILMPETDAVYRVHKAKITHINEVPVSSLSPPAQ